MNDPLYGATIGEAAAGHHAGARDRAAPGSARAVCQRIHHLQEELLERAASVRPAPPPPYTPRSSAAAAADGARTRRPGRDRDRKPRPPRACLRACDAHVDGVRFCWPLTRQPRRLMKSVDVVDVERVRAEREAEGRAAHQAKLAWRFTAVCIAKAVSKIRRARSR